MQSQSPLLAVLDPSARQDSPPTHAVVILTDGVLEERSKEIDTMMKAVPGKAILYLYLEPGTIGVAGQSCWDFGKFYGGGASKTEAGLSISSHEGLKYRFVDPPLMKYEHVALVTELLVRMKPLKEEVFDGAALVVASSAVLSPVAALPINSHTSFIATNEVAVDECLVLQLRAQIAHQDAANAALRVELMGSAGDAVDAACCATTVVASVKDLRLRVHELAGEHFALNERVTAKRKEKQQRKSIITGEDSDAVLRVHIEALKAANAQLLREVDKVKAEAEAVIAALRAEVSELKKGGHNS
tara:strand:+ start:58 stop:960 length:903 start_codon:yes stop_codon:yes gene_type:complete